MTRLRASLKKTPVGNKKCYLRQFHKGKISPFLDSSKYAMVETLHYLLKFGFFVTQFWGTRELFDPIFYSNGECVSILRRQPSYDRTKWDVC